MFDTNRLRYSKLPLIVTLFSQRVRDLRRILDRNIYSLIEHLTGAKGMDGHAWNAVRETFCGEEKAIGCWL